MGDVSTHTIRGLVDGRTYYVVVRANTADGTRSRPSNQAFGVARSPSVGGLPPAPTPDSSDPLPDDSAPNPDDLVPTPDPAVPLQVIADFDGDLRADVAIYRPLKSVWQVSGSTACVLLAAWVGACNLDPQQASRRYLDSADAYLAQDKIAEAIIEYRNAVQQDPLSFEARDKLGDVLAQVGDLGNAASQLVSAADLRPDDPDVQVKAGSILLVVRQPAEARDRAERALALDSEHVGAHLVLAQALAGLNDLDAAVAAAERAVALEPTQSGPYIALGSFQMELDQSARALESLRRAVEVDDQSAAPRLALARFHWVNGAIDEAEAVFQAAVGIDPGDLIANRSLAAFYVGTNRLREAEPYLQAVAEIAETPLAQLMLANFYARTDRPARAVTLLEPLSEDPITAAQANVHLAALDYEAATCRTQWSDCHSSTSEARENASVTPRDSWRRRESRRS